MIKPYPEFTSLTINHRQQIKDITDKFEPYSDFNFTSLFCWNVNESTEISILEGNLVIKLPDYVTGRDVYSILGTENMDVSMSKLLSKVSELCLVPEITVRSLKKSDDYKISEDADNFDYVFLLEEHARLNNGAFKEKRKKKGRFERNHKGRFSLETIDLSDPGQAQRIREVFRSWLKVKDKIEADAKNESIALERLLAHADRFNTFSTLITVDGAPAGFSIHEVIDNDYTISHFHKTLANYNDIDVYLTSYAAEQLANQGYKYDNWEQDLGIIGLKASKQSYKPHSFLKKYRITRR